MANYYLSQLAKNISFTEKNGAETHSFCPLFSINLLYKERECPSEFDKKESMN